MAKSNNYNIIVGEILKNIVQDVEEMKYEGFLINVS